MAGTEFGGEAQNNGIQPPVTPDGLAGHTPTNSELQMLAYRTGQVADSTYPVDTGEAFRGELPEDQQALIAPRPSLYREAGAAE